MSPASARAPERIACCQAPRRPHPPGQRGPWQRRTCCRMRGMSADCRVCLQIAGPQRCRAPTDPASHRQASLATSSPCTSLAGCELRIELVKRGDGSLPGSSSPYGRATHHLLLQVRPLRLPSPSRPRLTIPESCGPTAPSCYRWSPRGENHGHWESTARSSLCERPLMDPDSSNPLGSHRQKSHSCVQGGNEADGRTIGYVTDAR